LVRPRFKRDPDSTHGGWGFNLQDDDYWRYKIEGSTARVPIDAIFANDIPDDQLKSRPFFDESEHAEIYSDNPVTISPALREELLANEFPALTFAAGHRGVREIRENNEDRDVDIRQKFLRPNSADSAPWPEDRPRFEWRHSDIYVVAYPYLSGLYDEWVREIKGVLP
jgi:hypothetical protein